jgi:hypothetical protein
VDTVELLVEEDKAVRQESLDGLSRLQTIAQYGLASTGVAIGLDLVAADESATAAALILQVSVGSLYDLPGHAGPGLERERVDKVTSRVRCLHRGQVLEDALGVLRHEGVHATERISPGLAFGASKKGPSMRLLGGPETHTHGCGATGGLWAKKAPIYVTHRGR